jgi:O-methyltransferase involved in polyketide biosynthesis
VKNPATQTALGPMVIVAVDQYENPPLVQDELAYQMLPARGKVVVIAAKWLPLRRLLIGATERKIPGLWASMLCRKRYIDEQLPPTPRSMPRSFLGRASTRGPIDCPF